MIKIKIKFPSFHKEKEGEEIKLKDVKNYLEKLKESGDVSEFYEKLKSRYKEFIESFKKVKRDIEILEKNGENKFTSLVKPELEKVGELEEFELDKTQKYYSNVSNVIDRIIKIPGQLQHESLNYEHGKETIDSLNSFVKRFDEFKKILAKRYSDYSVVNDLEKAKKKFEEVEELKRKSQESKEESEKLEKEKIENEKLLSEKEKELEDVKSKMKNKEIESLEKELEEVKNQINESKFYLRTNLLKAKRPITKILHSGDKKTFRFFNEFVESPLENINENFWEIVDLLKKERFEELEDVEKESIKEFLEFVRDKLEVELRRLSELVKKKRVIELKIEELKAENEKLLNKFIREKLEADEKLKETVRRFKRAEEEKNNVEKNFKKNLKILEKMIGRIAKREVKIIG